MSWGCCRFRCGFDLESFPRLGASHIFHLRGAGGVQSEGFETPAGFTVSSGLTRRIPAASTAAGPVLFRVRLLAEGVFVVDEEDTWRLSEPYSFDSPSTAAAVMAGRSANGLIK